MYSRLVLAQCPVYNYSFKTMEPFIYLLTYLLLFIIIGYIRAELDY